MGVKGRMLTNGLAVKLSREGSAEAVELAGVLNSFMKDKISKGLPGQIYRARQAMGRWKDATDPLGTARFDRHQRRWIQAVQDLRLQEAQEWTLRCSAKELLGFPTSPPPSLPPSPQPATPPPSPPPIPQNATPFIPFRPWETQPVV
jgi:hypothetical protein